MINITNFLFRSKRNTYIAATSLEWICPTLLDNRFLLYTRSHYVIIAQLLSRLGNIFFSQSFYRTFCSHILLFLADVSVFLTHHTIWGREDFIFSQTGSNCFLCVCGATYTSYRTKKKVCVVWDLRYWLNKSRPKKENILIWQWIGAWNECAVERYFSGKFLSKLGVSVIVLLRAVNVMRLPEMSCKCVQLAK